MKKRPRNTIFEINEKNIKQQDLNLFGCSLYINVIRLNEWMDY